MIGFGKPFTVAARSMRVSNTLRTSHPIVTCRPIRAGVHSARSALVSLHLKRRALTCERSGGRLRSSAGVHGKPEPATVVHEKSHPVRPPHEPMKATLWRWAQP